MCEGNAGKASCMPREPKVFKTRSPIFLHQELGPNARACIHRLARPYSACALFSTGGGEARPAAHLSSIRSTPTMARKQHHTTVPNAHAVRRKATRPLMAKQIVSHQGAGASKGFCAMTSRTTSRLPSRALGGGPGALRGEVAGAQGRERRRAGGGGVGPLLEVLAELRHRCRARRAVLARETIVAGKQGRSH